MLPAIDLIFFDAGGGHRAAANALQSVLAARQTPWNVRLVNLQEVLDPLDVFRKYTGVRLEDYYNKMLKRGWTLGSAQLLKLIHVVVAVNHSRAVRLLAKYWTETRPDMVVSLVPNMNRLMYDGLRRSRPHAPYVTILTDIADFPPHFWIERQQQYFICGSRRAVEQTRELGHSPERVFQVSGMILNPKFYSVPEVDRAAERMKLGLDPARTTALVMFGGQGSRAMLEITRRLAETNLPLQLILICGHNAALADQLLALKLPFPAHVVGFTKDVPYFMRLADFFIGKPGPGSISEAVAMQLPVIVEANAWTLPQERYNATWVRENGVGLVVRSFEEIVDATRRLLAPGALQAAREATAKIDNRAVYEIPAILERLLTMAACSPPSRS